MWSTTRSLQSWKLRNEPDAEKNNKKPEADKKIRRLKKELKRVTDERGNLKKA